MRLVSDHSLRLPRAAALAALTFLAVTAGPAQAQRDDQGLQLGCADDYFRLCIGGRSETARRRPLHDPQRSRLSPKCREAIGDYDRRTGNKSLPNN